MTRLNTVRSRSRGFGKISSRVRAYLLVGVCAVVGQEFEGEQTKRSVTSGDAQESGSNTVGLGLRVHM